MQAENLWANTTFNTEVSNLINDAVRQAVQHAFSTPGTLPSRNLPVRNSTLSPQASPNITLPNFTVSMAPPKTIPFHHLISNHNKILISIQQINLLLHHDLPKVLHGL